MATKDGLTAWEALHVLGPEPERSDSGSKIFKSDLALPIRQFPPSPTTWVTAKDDYNLLWTQRVSRFEDLLRKGSWYAKGYKVPVDPTARRERIQPDLWEILGIDLDKNTASGSGLEYAGLRFYEKKKVGKSLSREPVRRAELERFMEKRIADLKDAGGHSSARQDEQAARKHFKGRSIPRTWIEAFREEFNVPLEWSKRGRRN